MEFSSPSLKIIGFFRGLSKESFFCSLNIMTGAQASLLAMCVRFGREQATFTSEFLVIERFFASKTDAHCKQDACAPVLARTVYWQLITTHNIS